MSDRGAKQARDRNVSPRRPHPRTTRRRPRHLNALLAAHGLDDHRTMEVKPTGWIWRTLDSATTSQRRGRKIEETPRCIGTWETETLKSTSV